MTDSAKHAISITEYNLKTSLDHARKTLHICPHYQSLRRPVRNELEEQGGSSGVNIRSGSKAPFFFLGGHFRSTPINGHRHTA